MTPSKVKNSLKPKSIISTFILFVSWENVSKSFFFGHPCLFIIKKKPTVMYKLNVIPKPLTSQCTSKNNDIP